MACKGENQGSLAMAAMSDIDCFDGVLDEPSPLLTAQKEAAQTSLDEFHVEVIPLELSDVDLGDDPIEGSAEEFDDYHVDDITDFYSTICGLKLTAGLLQKGP